MNNKITDLINKNKFEVNPTARYRLIRNICIFKDIVEENDIPSFEYLFDDREHDEIKRLAYKVINGVKVYCRLDNDAIYLYADSTGFDNVEDFLDMQELSKAFNFTYTDINLHNVAKQCTDVYEFIQVLLDINIPYRTLIIEPLSINQAEQHVAIYLEPKREIYDFDKGIFGMSANKYKSIMRSDYRILGATN